MVVDCTHNTRATTHFCQRKRTQRGTNPRDLINNKLERASQVRTRIGYVVTCMLELQYNMRTSTKTFGTSRVRTRTYVPVLEYAIRTTTDHGSLNFNPKLQQLAGCARSSALHCLQSPMNACVVISQIKERTAYLLVSLTLPICTVKRGFVTTQTHFRRPGGCT